MPIGLDLLQEKDPAPFVIDAIVKAGVSNHILFPCPMAVGEAISAWRFAVGCKGISDGLSLGGVNTTFFSGGVNKPVCVPRCVFDDFPTTG